MAETEKPIWVVRGGKTGDADEIFLNKNFIATGWPQMGDLSSLKADRNAFKAKVDEIYRDKKPGAIPNIAGQLFRYVHEMKTSDIIVYPSKRDRNVHIGEIIGLYKFDTSVSNQYPNLRQVKWLKSVPRTQFSQGALYEIGSAMTIFQVRNYADEFRAVISGKAPQPLAPQEDKTVQVVSDDIEETTHDFILKILSKELKGHPLSHFVAQLLNIMGYQTRISPEGADGGVDIIAHRDKLGFEPPIIKVQVKSSDGSIGDPVVSALYGKVAHNEFGMIVTLGTFTPQAKSFARSKSNLRLIDGEELVSLILEYYESFDSLYKGLLPLKKVYVPVNLEDEE